MLLALSGPIEYSLLSLLWAISRLRSCQLQVRHNGTFGTRAKSNCNSEWPEQHCVCGRTRLETCSNVLSIGYSVRARRETELDPDCSPSADRSHLGADLPAYEDRRAWWLQEFRDHILEFHHHRVRSWRYRCNAWIGRTSSTCCAAFGISL
jgi:hypothetical protein